MCHCALKILFILLCIPLSGRLFSQQAELDRLNRALSTSIHDTVRVQTLNSLSNMLRPHYPDSALTLANDALKIARSARYNPGIALALLNIGRVHAVTHNVEPAREYFSRSLDVYKSIGDSEGQIQSLYNSGSVLYNNQQYNEALGYFEQCLAIVDQAGESNNTPVETVIWTVRSAGNILLRTGEYDRALTMFERLRLLGEKNGDYRTTIIALMNMGMVSDNRGMSSKALDYYKQCLDMATQRNDREAIQYVAANMAHTYANLGDYTSALENCRLAVKISEETGALGVMAGALLNMGHIQTTMGQYTDAVESYHRALNLYEDTEDDGGVSNALHAIGNIYVQMEEDSIALAHYTKGLVIDEKMGNKRQASYKLASIGSIYRRSGKYTEAIDYYERAIEIEKAIGLQNEIGYSLKGLAAVYLRLNEYEKSLDHLQQARGIFMDLNDKRGLSECNIEIAKLLIKTGKYQEGLRYARESAAIAIALGTVLVESEAYYSIAQALEAQHVYDSALIYYKKYTVLSDSIFSEEKQIQLSRLSAKYEAEQRDHQITLLEKDKRLQEVELARQKEELLRRELEAIRQEQALALLGQEKDYQALAAEQAKISLRAKEVEADRNANKVELLSKAQQLQEAKLSEAEIIRNSMIAGVVLLLIIAGVIYRQYHFKRQASERLQESYNKLKRAQQQLIHAEKMATLGELTAGVAHEIKNPLNFITNFSEMNADVVAEIEQEFAGNTVVEEAVALLRANTEKIREHGKRADGIVNGMLMHSRETRGVRQDTDVNELVREAVDLAIPESVKGSEVAVTLNLHPDTGSMHVLPAELSRVVVNILSNAVYEVRKTAEHSSPGYAPRVNVETLRRKDHIEIRTVDNGRGMSEAVQAKIFQPFFTTKPTGDGTGLGLSMCWDIIVNGHGGTIEVESNEGEGSKFIVKLPVE